MDYEEIEHQVDWLLEKVFPVVATIGCVLAAIYFGSHLMVAWINGWI